MFTLHSKLCARTPDEALSQLRTLATTNLKVQRRLSRLGLLVALGRTVRITGEEPGVQAFQTAIQAYAKRILKQRGLHRESVTPAELARRARQGAVTLSLHGLDGWITATYHVTFDGAAYHITANDRRTRQFDEAELQAVFTTTFTLTVTSPDQTSAPEPAPETRSAGAQVTEPVQPYQAA